MGRLRLPIDSELWLHRQRTQVVVGSAGALLTGSCKLKYRQSMLIISLSLARPGSAVSLSRITPNQFGMCYRKALPQEKERAQQRLGILSEVISLNIEIELILKMMRIYPALEERTLWRLITSENISIFQGRWWAQLYPALEEDNNNNCLDSALKEIIEDSLLLRWKAWILD